jgi:hypothetical protein
MPMRTVALVFLSATLFGSTVFAEDAITLTGTDNSVAYSLQFDVANSFLNTDEMSGVYMLTDVPILVDGSTSETATVNIVAPSFLDISLNDTGSDMFGFSAANPFTVTDGTTTTFVEPLSTASTAFVDCSAKLTMPGRSALPTLAMLQMPRFTTDCGDTSTLTIGAVGAAATPEPASFSLLALGGIGLLGVFGRALWGRFRFMAASH